MSKLLKSAALILAATLAMPVYAARGKADFTMFVALGDSYGAGYASSSLNENHQVYGWPAIIAKQVGLKICPTNAAATDLCFAVPLVSYPGIGPETVLSPTGVPTSGVGSGSPRMAGFGRPYNNLSVPGYTVGAALTLTGTEANAGLGQLILRGLGTEVQQAISLHPTFIAMWLGGNDFLGAVSQGNPAGLTSVADFTTRYNAILDQLIAANPNAGMVVGTLPESFAAAPLTAQLPAVVFDANFQPVLVGGNAIPFIYTPGTSTTPINVPTGSIVLLSALPRIQIGVGRPPALGGTGALTDAEVITPTEQTAFATAIAAYNNVIRTAAQTRDIPVADIKGLFDRIASPAGIQVGPFNFNKAFVRGGLFSFDGAHPSDVGYVLFANEFIKAINAGYKTRIPLANISQFLANNDPALQSTNSFGFGPDVAAAMTSVFNSVTTPAPPLPRKRSIK
jgi:lysophospholipase L1-like esterase